MKIVGISGKIGSGKDYLANKLIIEMNSRNLLVKQTSFAFPLKSEIFTIIQIIRKNRNLSYGNIAVLISGAMTMTIPEANMLIDCLYEEVTNDETLDGYSRTFGIRDSLQKLGTAIRRKHNPSYWTEKFLDYISTLDADLVFVSDARFPNEMDTVVDNNGYAIRINLTQEVLEKRRSNRDGIIYTPEQLNHISETALDNYDRFSVVIGETFDVKELAGRILEL